MRKCHDFFEKLDNICLDVTYDEVLVLSDLSEVLPWEVSLKTRFSRNVDLNVPIVSAAMDTVTESEMAILMAKCGGIGVIHRGLTVEEQRDEVRRVKFHLSGIIKKPVTVSPEMTMAAVKRMKDEKHFVFHTFPVVDSNGALKGLITTSDFRYCEDDSLTVADIMTPERELITAPANATIDEAYALLVKHKKTVIPLVEGNMLAGMYLWNDIERIKSGKSMHNVDSQGRLRVAAAVGVYEDAYARAEALEGYADVLVIDVAHADSPRIFQTVKELKKVTSIDIVAGNISRGCSALRICEAGADGIKVGQGPGSICTTRVVTGVGRPQVTAIYDVAAGIEESYPDIPVCADGGIKQSGHITIALAAGAHCVMLGKLLAGTVQTPGEIIRKPSGEQVKEYRGMGSLGAMIAHQGSRERYLQGHVSSPGKFVPEGVEGKVPLNGDAAQVIYQYLGGLRQGMGSSGARTIEELRQKANFRRHTEIGARESHVHGVQMVQDAPNYRGGSW